MKILYSLVFMMFACSGIRAGELILTGNYYGNNLVVINPSFGNGFCVTDVFVNNIRTEDELNSNSFEIDFSALKLKIGEAVTVVIRHHDGCIPKVVNPQALKGDQQFTFTYIKFDRAGKLNWKVTGNLGEDAFIVEHYRWNKWTQVGEVNVNDTLPNGNYLFEPVFHSGINQFRVLRLDAYGNPVYSKTAKFNNARVQPAELESAKVSDRIVFSAETIYELFDEKGNFITGGYAKEVDISDLDKGRYFLNYDVKSVMITKK